MGFYRRIEDLFQRPPANTIHFSEAERALQLKRLQEDPGPFSYTDEGFTYPVDGRNVTVRWADIIRAGYFTLEREGSEVAGIRLYWEGGDLAITEEAPGWYQFITRLKQAGIVPAPESPASDGPGQESDT